MKIYPKCKSWSSLRRYILNKPSFKRGFYFSPIEKIFWNKYWKNRRFVFPKRYSIGFSSIPKDYMSSLRYKAALDCYGYIPPDTETNISDDIYFMDQNGEVRKVNESRTDQENVQKT